MGSMPLSQVIQRSNDAVSEGVFAYSIYSAETANASACILVNIRRLVLGGW